MKKRGVKSKVMTSELKLLLTLRHLRYYPTFINLGATFRINESYANKIFNKTINCMLRFIHPKKSSKLSSDDVCTVAIYVAEQEIEWPAKKQKSYCSGKGKAHNFKMFKDSKCTHTFRHWAPLGDSGC